MKQSIIKQSIIKPIIKLKIALPFLILLAFLVFLLAGCEKGETEMSYNFKQGIAEASFKLMKNAPPEKIYPDSNFMLVVEVDNPAAYDVNDGKISIVGLDDKYFNVYPLTQNFGLLAGRSFLNPSGEKKMIEFDGYSGELFQNAREYTGPFFLQGTYHSTMEFADTVCLNPNRYQVYDGGCQVEERKTYAGQGAPLAVTEIEEIISPGSEVEFRVQLKNKGRGKVTSVRLTSASLGGKELPCEFPDSLDKKEITMKRDEQEVRLVCRSFLRSFNSYVTSLALGFSYDYEFRQEHRLKIVR